jgi:protease I
MRRVLVVIFLLLFTSILLIGCKGQKDEASVSQKEEQMSSPEAAQTKALSGKKVVMIISPENFRDEELIEPQNVLTEQGALVKVASLTTETCKGMLGVLVKPDMRISDIIPDQWDAIILIGGSGSTKYWDDTAVHSLLNDAVKKNKIVGAICLAPVTCANAGILTGKKATVSESAASTLIDKGAEYTGASVQRDGKIITASGPPAAKEFGEAIASALKE